MEGASERLELWAKRLEMEATSLLDGVDYDEMSAKERFDCASKCVALIQKCIMIARSLDDGAGGASGATQAMLEHLMSRLRGQEG